MFTNILGFLWVWGGLVLRLETTGYDGSPSDLERHLVLKFSFRYLLNTKGDGFFFSFLV